MRLAVQRVQGDGHMQLTENFYKRGGKLFGLKFGEMIASFDDAQKLFHNGAWFNGHGQYLGFGDVSSLHVRNIAYEIAPGESFIIMSQNPWSECVKAGLEPENPGLGYIARHAALIVSCSKVQVVRGDADYISRALNKYGRIILQILAREEFAREITKNLKV